MAGKEIKYEWTELDILTPAQCDAKSLCEGWTMKGYYTSMTTHDGVSNFYYKSTSFAPEKDKARLSGAYVTGIGL